MMMAGGSPQGEVTAIRELMPKSHIVAVDRDEKCLEAAIIAGVDDVVDCDVLTLTETRTTSPFPTTVRTLPRPLLKYKFDILSLDLCGCATPHLKQCAPMYLRAVPTAGVFILTFSYGRDVAEMFAGQKRSWPGRLHDSVCTLPPDVPESVAGRILYLFSPTYLNMLCSIMVYRGSEMPMCSLLFQYNRFTCGDISFVKVEPGDYEVAVCYPDSVNLYDCPQARIEAWRRQFAAIKASFTRIEKARIPLLFEADKP
jgi:hypothetical protein